MKRDDFHDAALAREYAAMLRGLPMPAAPMAPETLAERLRDTPENIPVTRRQP